VRTKGAFVDETEGMKVGKGYTVQYIGEMMPLLRAKVYAIVPFRVYQR
jgi:hypothetical protein